MNPNENPNPEEVNKKFDEIFSNPQPSEENKNETKENKSGPQAQSTQAKPNTFGPVLPSLPNGSTAFALGIVGVVLSVLWCYGVFSLFGLICGIVALVLSKDGKRLEAQNPGGYNAQSVSNNNTAKVLGIVAIVMGSLGILGTAAVAAFLFFVIERASDAGNYNI